MTRHLFVARDAFLMASAAMICMLGLLLFASDGPQAVATLAGVPTGSPSHATLKMMLAFDTVLPISYAAGFILLGSGLAKNEDTRRLLPPLFLFVFIGVSMDFIENGIAIGAAFNNGAIMPFATILKYGGLGIAAFILSVILEPKSFLGNMAIPIMRYVTPISLALLLSGVGGETAVWFFVLILLGTFIFLAAVAHFEGVGE